MNYAKIPAFVLAKLLAFEEVVEPGFSVSSTRRERHRRRPRSLTGASATE